MSARRGRKKKYEEYVKPYLEDIKEWCATMTEKQIAQKLGIAYSTFNVYKNDFPELTETIKKGRQDVVSELRSALIKSASGFTYVETKVTQENGTVTKTETTTKYQPPNVAAINLGLKNYDKEHWSNDPQALDIKKKELKLKEKQIENNSW